MQMAQQVDISTLNWVKGEIDETLNQARITLEDFFENQEEENQIEKCVGYLHQVLGTLQMVGLGGAAQFAEEIEQLAKAIQEDRVQERDQAFEVLMRAILQLPDYLESLQAGQPDNPIILLPLINELRQLHGAPRLSESLFFHPDLSITPPVSPDEIPEKDKDIVKEASAIRKHYQSALLGILRGEEPVGNLRVIAAVLRKLYMHASVVSVARWLWVSQGYVAGVRRGVIELNKNTKTLLGKIDQLIKLLIESSESELQDRHVNELTRALLFYIARSSGDEESLAEIKQAFRLDELLPNDEAGTQLPTALGGFNAELKQTVSADIMEDLEKIKDQLDIFVRGDKADTERLVSLADGMTRIGEILNLLQKEGLSQSMMDQVAEMRQIIDGGKAADEATLMGVAASLLSVESSLRDWGSVVPVEQADDLTEQVSEQDAGPEAEAEHRRVIRQVMKEAKDELVLVRDLISQYLQDPQNKTPLDAIPEKLHQIVGSLSMLSYKRAAQVVESCHSYVSDNLINASEVPQDAQLDELADAIMSVEYFLEAFVENKVHPGSALDVAEQAVGALGYPIETKKETAISIEAEVEAPAVEVEQEAPVAEAALPEIAEAVAAEPETEVVEEITETVTEEAVPASIADETVEVALELPAEEQVEVAQAAETAGVEIDDEILEIFIEEAEEELDSIGELLPRWMTQQSDEEALAELRRSFHTLKGSGRLVGAEHVGEFAWAFENMLNQVIDGTVATNNVMFDILEQSREALSQLLEQFKGGSAPTLDVDMLMEAANKLSSPAGMRSGESAGEITARVEAGAAELGQLAEEEKGAPRYAQLDPVLLDIYAKEVDTHIQTISDFIANVRHGGSKRVSEPLIRALHTLQGSSRMAGIDEVGELAAVLERYAKAIEAHQESVDDEALSVLEESGHFVRAMVAYLQDQDQPFPERTKIQQRANALFEAVQHLDEAIKAQPEAGLAIAPEVEVAEQEQAALEEGEEITAVEEPVAHEGIEVTEAAEVEEEQAVAMAVADEYDQDLLEIFLEEGGEILDASEETLQSWVDNPDDRSLVATLQRQLHTLKGGARMAGVSAIGDLSHSLESTFEGVVDGTLQRSREMVELLQLAHDRLVTMLEQVRNHEPMVSGDDLIERVDELARVSEGSAEISEASSLEATDEEEAIEITPVAEEIVQEVEEYPVEASAAAFELPEKLSSLVGQLHEIAKSWKADRENQQYLEQLQQCAQSLEDETAGSEANEIGNLSQTLSKILHAVLDGHIAVSDELFTLLELADEDIRYNLQQLEQNGASRPAQGLVARFNDLAARGREAAEPLEEIEEKAEAEEKGHEYNRRRGARIQHEMVRVRADLLNNLVNYAGEVSIYRSRVEQQIGTFRFNIDEMDQTIARLRDQVRKFDIETEAQIESRYEEAVSQGYEDFDPLEFDRFTNMQQLSRSMMESLNDLISIEEMLLNLTRESETLLLQQSRVNTELQESLMQTRMVPLVENAPRLRRIVRQTCAELGKQANLRFQGAEVKMDRTVIERMMAPLEHMLRNAIAHGIEDSEIRRLQDKPEAGTITISLSREGSEIIVRVNDDGAGINLDVVRSKAIDRGLLDASAEISDSELMQYILESGLSTAESLSQISGRGVGMDVVNSEIKQLGGVLEIASGHGKGTTFTTRLPLTLSVSRALLISAGDETFAIPLLGIQTIERVERGELQRLMDSEQQQYQWLGNGYELLNLASILGIPSTGGGGDAAKQPLLLAQSGEQRVALVIDGLLGSREIVVKSMGPQLSQLPDLAGATILADGSVALILDMPSLIRHGMAKRMAQASEGIPEVVEVAEIGAEPVVMVVDDSITVRKVTERLLKRNEMKSITAKDGVDALTVLEEQVPDVMLLDIEMPRMDGYELATHIRNSERLKDLPIIMITSRAGEKHKQRALDIGVNIYMGKPFTESDLLENIIKLISEKKQASV